MQCRPAYRSRNGVAPLVPRGRAFGWPYGSARCRRHRYALVSLLKVMSDLDIAHALGVPQDGSFRMRLDQVVDFRVAIGQRLRRAPAVIRILDREAITTGSLHPAAGSLGVQP